ncbi:hypothetical protein TIFTF001_020474 [Ficus carica]|uniref:SWIM-type domain-containing protein n=1 Tax=Ficus carica TaxID=3494 RepID=A0AA88AFU4_FICCA|nr:hypothetical protein TIFTF001_020474 [Ficus carica]
MESSCNVATLHDGSREGGQSDEAMQHVDDSNLFILPLPPHIPSPTIGLDLHTKSGIEKLHQVLNNDLCTVHGDCNAGEMNVADDARHPNENSITVSIGAHSIANNTTSQSFNVPSNDSVSGSVVVDDYTPVTMHRNYIFDNKKLLQYHLHHDVMSKRYQFKAEFGVSFNYLRAWRGKEAVLTSLRSDDAESYNVIVVDGSALKAKFGGMLLAACGHDVNDSIFSLAFGIVLSESNESWKWFFEKLRDSISTGESLAIVADRHKGIEYAANLVYPDAVFGICVQHLATNLKTRYKDFKGPWKTYFDGASRSYLLSEHHRHMESIHSHNPDMHRYLVQADPTKWSRAYFNRRSGMVEGTATKMSQPADQFEYAVTNNAGQIWIVDMSERTCTCKRFQVDQIPCPHAMAVCNHRRIDSYNYCSNYYTKDYLYACYSSVVHPIGSAEGWDVPEEVRS